MDQKRFDQISRTLATGLSRRGVLRVLGVGGASGLLAVVGQAAMAGERPHQHLQDRSEQRNRKQRQNGQNDNNDQNDKHERAHHHRLRDVEATFINNGFTDLVVTVGSTNHYLKHEQRVTVTQSLSHLDAILDPLLGGAIRYVFSATNPGIGLPWVQITEITASGENLLLDERLVEGEQASCPGFLVGRLADTANNKVFELYKQNV
jgi:hypothetical protein